MPPKLQARVKELIGAPTDDEAQAVLQAWIDALPRYQAKARELAVAQAQVAEAQAAEPSATIITNLEEYRSEVFQLLQHINSIKTSIAIRIPEQKEEDNLGVNVQASIFEAFGVFESQLQGGSGGDKSSDKASLLSVGAKREYFAARAAIEEKLLGSGKEDAPPAKAPSYQKQLQQLDADMVARLALSWGALYRQVFSLVVAYSNNNKKLVQPRMGSDRFMN